MVVMPLAVALLWPAMLPWLVAAVLPLMLAWWAVWGARRIRWAAIDLVEQAARAARITRSGLPWPLTLVRMLMIVCVALAATRPFFGNGDRPHGRQVVAGAAATRIEIVVATDDDESVRAIRRVIEAVARTRPRSSPTVDLVALGEAGRPSTDCRLVILGDGVVPGPDDIARLTAAVHDGASLLVCLGPESVASPTRSRITAWLDKFVGVSVAGTVPLDDEMIEATGTREGSSATTFVTLLGPRVARAADLFFKGDEHGGMTVLARTASAGRPLVVERRAGRGRVCVSALPLTLPTTGDDAAAWSDVAAWPAFVPFVDRLVSGLLLPDDGADAVPLRPRSRFAGLPLARPLLACGLALIVVETVLARYRAGAAGERRSAVSLVARAFVIAAIVAMVAVWGGRPATRPSLATKPASVAVVIDVSPSMATADGPPSPSSAKGPTPRLRELFAAVLRGDAGDTALDRLARGRSLEIHLAAADVRRLGLYPAEVSADDLRRLAPSPPAMDASRLGDAVAAVIEQYPAGGLAAAVVISDGAITGGASWGDAAGIAARRGVPLVAVPVGDDATAASGLPSGFRFTALEVPTICRPDEQIVIPVRGVASTISRDPLVLHGEGSEAALVADPSPTASGYEYACDAGLSLRIRAAARTDRTNPTAAPATAFTQTLTLAVGDDEGGHVATAPTIVADDPVRVLLVDRAPRYEFRFLERLLSGDPRYLVTSRWLSTRGSVGQRFTDPLPQSVAEWSAFDVVVLGDVPVAGAPEANAAVWEGLREAVIRHGVGIAWLPGRRWAEADAGMVGWLPAVAGTDPPAAAEAMLPRRLRVLPSGRATGWFSFTDATGDGAATILLRTFTQLPAPEIRPTARVVAVMETSDRAEPSPAIIVDRVGRGTVVGHLCDTWRWQGDDEAGEETAHARYWHHLLPRLAERRRMARLVAATMAVRPLDPVVGEPVRVDVMPTQPAADLSGWELEIEPPDGPARRLRCEEEVSGGIATLQLTGLAAGRHRLRLVPAAGAGTDVPAAPIEREIVVNKPRVEQADEPAGTGPMRVAMGAHDSEVVSLDHVETLPDTIAAVLRSQDDRGAVGGHWLATQGAAHLLLAAFVTACATAWWPRSVPAHGIR